MEKSQNGMPDRLLSGKAVTDRIGCGMSKFYKMLNAGEFPPGVRVGTQSVRWRESTVTAWIDSRPVVVPKNLQRDHQNEAA